MSACNSNVFLFPFLTSELVHRSQQDTEILDDNICLAEFVSTQNTSHKNPLLFVSRQLTHEEVKDGHVHDVQKSCPTVIRWSLFDLLAVVRVHLPPDSEISNDVLFTVSFLFEKTSQNLFDSSSRCNLTIFFLIKTRRLLEEPCGFFGC